jgi:hypothetical protein
MSKKETQGHSGLVMIHRLSYNWTDLSNRIGGIIQISAGSKNFKGIE